MEARPRWMLKASL